MNRREFITLLGGAAVTWPVAARAQQTMPRVAVIMVHRDTDRLGQGRLHAFVAAFENLGWRTGHNVQIDVRWAAGSAERMRQIAAEVCCAQARRDRGFWDTCCGRAKAGEVVGPAARPEKSQPSGWSYRMRASSIRS